MKEQGRDYERKMKGWLYTFWTCVILLILITLLLIVRCERLEYAEVETYCVSADDHHSDFPKFMQVKEEIFVKVFFHKSCRYDPQPQGMSGWNKLVGLSQTINPHRNSARWAWRYDHDTDMIKLASYIWINGVNPTEQNGGIEYIYSVPIEQGDFLEGEDWTELYVGYINEYWKLLTGDSESLGTKMEVPGLGETFYIEGLWFGGNGVPEQETCVSYAFGEMKGFRINTD